MIINVINRRKFGTLVFEMSPDTFTFFLFAMHPNIVRKRDIPKFRLAEIVRNFSLRMKR